ncbi:hypothetical protein [Paraburkholderia sp. J7]|uniref:hypothetical protein n=1 Tax=Paraburkholderia sp. J7 TaxID=2805438 RepID=UPI002AB73283|nr:hypothetical protein [Paraburkholderia sp. J7]
MDKGNVSAIISALAGISGVLLGGAITALKEWLIHRSRRKTETAYLAAIVVSHLDRFANACLHVALDDGTAYGQPAGENGEHEPTVTAPDFQPLDIDVEWKVLPQDLMYAILRVPDQREQIQNRIAGIAEFVATPPDHSEYFHARQRDYAELGLKVSELALRLRKHTGMPIETTHRDEWSRDNELRNVIERIDELEAAAARHIAKHREKFDSLS